MSIDIPMGTGSPHKEEPEESKKFDVVEEIEVEPEPQQELEQELPPSEPTPVAASVPRPPGGRSLKKAFIIIVVGVLIISAGVFAYVLLPKDVSLSTTISPTGLDDGIHVTTYVSADTLSEMSGSGNVKVSFIDGTVKQETYTGTVSFGSNRGDVTIDYMDFVVQNGDYEIEVIFEGATSTNLHTVQYLIETVNVTLFDSLYADHDMNSATIDEPVMKAQFTSSTASPTALPMGTTITIDSIVYQDGFTTIPPVVNDLRLTSSNMNFVQNYQYTNSGDYTITVSIENQHIKLDSPMKTVTESFVLSPDSSYYVMLDVTPQVALANGDTVTFDATGSMDDTIGNDIEEYFFNFGDGSTYTETPTNAPDGTFDGITTHVYGFVVGEDLKNKEALVMITDSHGDFVASENVVVTVNNF